jgi:hypothetical protein
MAGIRNSAFNARIHGTAAGSGDSIFEICIDPKPDAKAVLALPYLEDDVLKWIFPQEKRHRPRP